MASEKTEQVATAPTDDPDEDATNKTKEDSPILNGHKNNDNDNNNNDKQNKKKNDKNIHVPKDKKLKIEYVSVKNAFVENDIVFYDINVKTLQHYWHVTKRYSQFEELHNQLIHISTQKLPLLPAKHYKWFTDHTQASFIEKRRALLDNYVKKLIKTKNVNCQQCVVNFFHNDKQSEKLIEERQNKKDKDNENDDNDNDNNDDNDEDDNDDNNNNNEHKHEPRQSDEWDFPSEQEVTNIVIQSTRKMTDHVLYQICVSNSHKRASFRAWTVLKRFTQFYDMDQKLRIALQDETPNLLPQLPPAPTRKFKFVHDHMDDDFIEERRVLLENYLSKLLRFQSVVRNEAFLDFLGVD